ncbi:MAG: DUF3343 domain-containing protein [Desulfatiglandales bacterium]
MEDPKKKGRGIFVFENTSEVIRAEKVLKEAGLEVRVVGPPPSVRRGCDLAIEYPLIQHMWAVRLLTEHKIPPLDSLALDSGVLSPVELFQTKDFGRYLMVKAANMKITIDKETLQIVNISGGGCPDVPYISKRMVGHSLYEAPAPKEIGHTLCGYALQLAYEELLRILDQKREDSDQQ